MMTEKDRTPHDSSAASTEGPLSGDEQSDVGAPAPSAAESHDEDAQRSDTAPVESTTTSSATPASPAVPSETDPAPTPEAPAEQTAAVPVESAPVESAPVESAPVAAAPVAATDSKVVYVSAPPEPKKRGARGVGALVAFLSAAIFAAVYAGLVLIVSLIASPSASGVNLETFAAPQYWVPVIVFTLSYLLLVVIVNRAGWWAHVLGGFVVAVLVYLSFIGAAIIVAGQVGGAPEVVGPIVIAQLTNPLGFAAAVAAREVPVWVGGLVAKRGRTVSARNAEARAAYQRDVEAHRESMNGTAAV